MGVEAVRDPQFGAIADKNLVLISPELHHARTADDRFVLVGPTFDDRAASDESWTAPPGAGPLVLLSLGTLTKVSSKFYGEVFEAFRDHPARFVMHAGRDLQRSVGPFPDNFTVSDSFLPQLRILEECDALISNGGMGSVQQGLHRGVPQILIPQMIENVINARRVAELGAGVVLGDQPPYGRVRAASLRRALDAVLTDDDYRDGRKSSAPLGGRRAGMHERRMRSRSSSPGGRAGRRDQPSMSTPQVSLIQAAAAGSGWAPSVPKTASSAASAAAWSAASAKVPAMSDAWVSAGLDARPCRLVDLVDAIGQLRDEPADAPYWPWRTANSRRRCRRSGTGRRPPW